jgi:hypothetical protein
MPNYIKLGNLRIEIPEPANNGGGGGGGGSSSLLTGLLAFYNLSDLTDASGNGNTLTNTNGVTFSSGKIGNAAVFNQSNRLQATIPSLAAMTAGDFTVACWVYINNSVPSDAYIISQSGGMGLRWGNPSQNTFIINNSQADNPWVSNLAKDKWYHVAGVASGNSLLMYIDGSLATTLNKQNYPSQSNLFIGAYGDILLEYSFNDKIDAVGIWSRALTNTEITELYNAGAGKEYPFA